jgi:hypothetical protein
MSFTGGDIVEITYNHPTIGSGTLLCKANEDGTMERGGRRSVDDTNMVTGDGQMIDQINMARWSFETPPIAWDMTGLDESEQLSRLAGSPVLADWTITHINGAIWGGKGKPVGELPGATNTAQLTLKLSGSGRLRRIS